MYYKFTIQNPFVVQFRISTQYNTLIMGHTESYHLVHIHDLMSFDCWINCGNCQTTQPKSFCKTKFLPNTRNTEQHTNGIYRRISNISRTKSPNLNWPHPSSCLCPIKRSENEDVVGAAPTGEAPTTYEWSAILLHTKVRLILETWRYYEVFYGIPFGYWQWCTSLNQTRKLYALCEQ